MAISQERSDLEEQQLIEKHIDLNFDLYPYGRADAWLKESGVSVWILMSYVRMYDGDVARVASEYDLSPEEMDAALAYYRRYRKYVDARILLNEA